MVYKFRSDGTFHFTSFTIIPYDESEVSGSYTMTDQTITFDHGVTEVVEYTMANSTLTIYDLDFGQKPERWLPPTIGEMIALRPGEKFRAYFGEDGKYYVVHTSLSLIDSDSTSVLADDENAVSVFFYLPEPVALAVGTYTTSYDWVFTYDNVLEYKSYNANGWGEISIITSANGIVEGTFGGIVETDAGTTTSLYDGRFVLDTK